MMTTDEAVQFCNEILGIKEVTMLLKEKPLHTLNILIKNFHEQIPFQNITLLSCDIGSQAIPTLDEIKASVFARLGGLCYTNNVFICCLLRALGLDTYNASGICNLRHPNNHIVTIVCGLTSPRDYHLVDVGCGTATYEAVKLVDISQVYRSGFLVFKLVKEGDVYRRYHYRGQPSGGWSGNEDDMHDVKVWEWFYDFTLQIRDLEYFQSAMQEIYRNRFLSKVRVVTFKGDVMCAVKEKCQTDVKKECTWVRLSPEGREEKVILDAEIPEVIEQLLPQMNSEVINKGIENWIFFKSKHFTR